MQRVVEYTVYITVPLLNSGLAPLSSSSSVTSTLALLTLYIKAVHPVGISVSTFNPEERENTYQYGSMTFGRKPFRRNDVWSNATFGRYNVSPTTTFG